MIASSTSEAQEWNIYDLLLLNYVGMDVIVPGVVLYQENSMVGRYCGGTMHKILSYQMSVIN